MARTDTSLRFNLVDGVTRVLRSIGSGLSTLNEQFANLNQTTELFGKGISAISSGFGFGPALVEAGQLEDILARVNSITAATTEQQVALQAAVIKASQDTRFTAEEAAGALALLAEDGLSATESIQQLGTVLQFAQANAQTAAQAAQGLGAVLDTFGASANQIGPLADQLTAVARASGTSTQALQEGLASAGIAAQQAGLSIETTVTALGALAKSGLDGNAAGKQLTKILQELSDPASKAGEAIRELGLDSKSFADVLQVLGKDSKAAEQVLSALGDRPRAALRSLLADGGGAVRELNGILRDSAGASKEASDAVNKTFLATLDRLVNSYTNARNAFLTPILQPLAEELDLLSKKLIEFTKTDSFASIKEQFTTFVTGAAEQFGAFVEAVDFNEVASRIAAFGTKAAEVFRAIGAAATSLTGVIKTVGEAFGAFRSIAETALNAVAGTAQKAAAGYVELFNAVTGGTEDSIAAARALQEASTESFTAARDASGEAGEKIAKLVGITEDAAAAAETNAAAQDAAAASMDGAAGSAEGVSNALGTIPPAADAAAGAVESSSTRQQEALNLTGEAARLFGEQLLASAKASEKVAKATGEVGKAAADTKIQTDDASDSTEKLVQTTGSYSETARRAVDASKDLSSETGNLATNTAGLSEEMKRFEKETAGRIIQLGEVSTLFKTQIQEIFTTQGGGGRLFGLYIRAFNDLTTSLADQKARLNEYTRSLNEQIAQYDPLAREMRNLQGLYPSLGDAALRAAAQQKLALKQLREDAKQSAEEIRKVASSSFGGGSDQGPSSGNAQGNAGGGNQNGPRGGRPEGPGGGNAQGNAGGSFGLQNQQQAPARQVAPTIINAAVFDERGLEELVRRIDKVQRRIGLSRV